MRLARQAANVLLTLIFLCEAMVVWELWIHGPPMVVTDEEVTRAGEYSFKLARAPVSTEDYLALIVAIALQVALVVFLWRSRPKISSD
jgi:hypothetical protein